MSVKMENKFVAKSISELYLQSDIADVHFACKTNGQTVKVPAHKTILAAENSVFRAMFFGPMKENEAVDIVDADANALEEFLQFFYLSEVKLTVENIEAVVRLADKYNMLDCVNSCAAYLESQLNKSNIIWGYQLAISLNNQKLKQICEDEIQHASIDTFKSDAFLQCDREVIKNILQMKVLCCNEVNLFDACIEWAKRSCQANGLDGNDPDNLREQLGDCLYLIQFGSMAEEDMGMIMSNKLYRGLFTKNEMADIFCIRSINNFQPETFKYIMRSPKWDSNNVLTCIRGFNNLNRYVIKSRESTWFSTNIPVLLGEIVSVPVYNKSGYNVYTNPVVAIIEYNEQTFPTDGASKILYEGTMNIKAGSTESVSLTRTIIINPQKMYEIRLEPTPSPINIFHCFKWSSEVNLCGGVTIKFHRDPTNYSSQHGLVKELKFNRITK